MTRLQGNAAGLSRAMERDGWHWVRDSTIYGTMFVWPGDGRGWVVADSDRDTVRRIQAVAVVTLKGDADADAGLNQATVACDLDVQGGEWIVDANDLPALQEAYGDRLAVLWESAAKDVGHVFRSDGLDNPLSPNGPGPTWQTVERAAAETTCSP